MKKTLALLAVCLVSACAIATGAQASSVLPAPPITEISSVDELQTGWYLIKCTRSSYSAAGKYVYNGAAEYRQNASNSYPLFLQQTAAEPATGDATYYVRIVRDGSQFYVQSANGHYLKENATATATPMAIAIDRDDYGFTIGKYWRHWPTLGNIWGLAAAASNERYALYRVGEEDMPAEWTVSIPNAAAAGEIINSARITCSSTGLKSAATAYDGGRFFFEQGAVPAAADFTMSGAGDDWNVIVNAENRTIIGTAGEVVGTFDVKKGYQTTGRGCPRAMLLRIALIGHNSSKLAYSRLHVKLSGHTAENISGLAAYYTDTPEFYAVENPQKIGETTQLEGDDIVVPITSNPLKPGNNYVWVAAAVKEDAALGETIDAALLSLDYVYDGENKTEDFAASGNPAGGLQIFAAQSVVFAPTSDGSQYYRIPAMILDKEGNIVAAADRRYNTYGDLGNHKIDIGTRKSTDGGRTWSAQRIIAAGDGATDAAYGYGDAALARTQSGRLLCLMAAGKTGFWDGMQWAAISSSDDNGTTWTAPRQLFASNFTDLVNGKTDGHGFFSLFVSSGKGLTTADGTVMFTTNCLTFDNKTSPQCYILQSSDEGEHWKLGPTNAYAGCDESKLVQRNDGSLLLSVRGSGYRGFNTGSSDATSWGSQWTSDQLPGAAVNADILCYARESTDGYNAMLHTYCKSSSRANLTLSISLDEGQTWSDMMTIQSGAAAYSTMVKLPNGDVGILFEDATYDAGNLYAITFVTVAKEQIARFTPAGIQTVAYGSGKTAVCFDLNGLRRQQPGRGLNIIRLADGSVRKVLVK